MSPARAGVLDLGGARPEDLPCLLADLHATTSVGQRTDVRLPPMGPSPAWPAAGAAHPTSTTPAERPTATGGPTDDDALPGAADLVEGAGFAVVGAVPPPSAERAAVEVTLERRRSLADTVGVGMGLLVCGLNPSEHAADAGVGFVTASNRFWPAALAAGLVSRDRDPAHALDAHGVGMTDLVKRATPRADALSADEYRSGAERLARLCRWLHPGAVAFVGLAGWRAAVDRRATAGPQAAALGGSPVYVLPSTSGLNARTSRQQLVEHLAAARALAEGR